MKIYYESKPDELLHYGVPGMKWGVRRSIRGHAGPGQYLTKKRRLIGDKKDLEYLNKGGHLSIGLTKKRQAAYDTRDKAALEKRIAKSEQWLSDKTVKKELKSDVKEFRKLRGELAKTINKSISKKTTRQDESRNLEKLKNLNDFTNTKIKQRGREYVARMLDLANKKDTVRARMTVAGIIGTGVAASLGLGWIQSKFS